MAIVRKKHAGAQCKSELARRLSKYPREAVKLLRTLACLFDLGVVKDGVEGSKNLRVKAIRKRDQTRNV